MIVIYLIDKSGYDLVAKKDCICVHVLCSFINQKSNQNAEKGACIYVEKIKTTLNIQFLSLIYHLLVEFQVKEFAIM